MMHRLLAVFRPTRWPLSVCVVLVAVGGDFLSTNENRLLAFQPPTKADLFVGKWNGKYVDDQGQKGEGTYEFHKEKDGRSTVTVAWKDEKRKLHEMKLQGKRLGLDGMSLEGKHGHITYRYLGRMEKDDLVLYYLSIDERTGRSGSGVSRLTRPNE